MLLAGSYTDGELVWVSASDFVTSAGGEGVGEAAAAGAANGARHASRGSDCEELLEERDGWAVEWGRHPTGEEAWPRPRLNCSSGAASGGCRQACLTCQGTPPSAPHLPPRLQAGGVCRLPSCPRHSHPRQILPVG